MPSLDLGNVMGPPGPQGSIWYQGTAVTGTDASGIVFSNSGITNAVVNDKYLNTGTNNVYTCVLGGNASVARWSWIGNIQGKTGPAGPIGPTGSVDINAPVQFSEAGTISNINSGDTIGTIFGKVKKMFSGLLAGALSTVLSNNLTASRVLVSNSNGKIAAGGITLTELGYLSGAKSNLQTQLNGKYGTASGVTFSSNKINAGNKASIWTDGEGGNIAIISPNGAHWEIDAHNEELRFYRQLNGTIFGFWLHENGRIEDAKGFYTPEIQRGNHTFDVSANGISEYKVTFPKAFSEVPTVVCSIYSSTSNTNYGQALALVKDVTNSNFVLRAINRSPDPISPNVQWIAVIN